MSPFDQAIQAQKLPREKVFRDPVHDYVHIRDKIILQLIDTQEFQRLRRIKQLGTSSYTFHGAEHSRFNHSLGVYEVTRRIISQFDRNYQSKANNDGLWQSQERMVAICAALLHDIGHGPFSHTFEGIFGTNHEELTQAIITSPETQINQILSQLGTDFPHKVASVINKTYPNQQVVQLISSQLDADRMDYLLRDAFYTGVSYGAFDLTRISRVIRPYQDQIAFDFSGMHAVEDFFISRYQMYMQVYFHPVSRGMEQVLKALFARAKDIYFNLPGTNKLESAIELLEPFLTGNWQVRDYLQLDDHVVSAYFHLWAREKDPILSDLAQRFLNRQPFKSIITSQAEREQLKTAVYTELMHFDFDPDYYLFEDSCFDLPYDYYRPGHESRKNQIELITKTQQVIELSEVSSLVRSLASQVRGDHRIFFPKELLSQIQKIAPEERNANQQMILLAYLNEHEDVTYHIQERLF